jgi:hypothetical protein
MAFKPYYYVEVDRWSDDRAGHGVYKQVSTNQANHVATYPTPAEALAVAEFLGAHVQNESR